MAICWSGNILLPLANNGSTSLILCPLSLWVGGCIFYPFTNIAAEHQREYPYHIVLVNDELCAWGAPAAILQRRRACASAGTAVLGSGGMLDVLSRS